MGKPVPVTISYVPEHVVRVAGGEATLGPYWYAEAADGTAWTAPTREGVIDKIAGLMGVPAKQLRITEEGAPNDGR